MDFAWRTFSITRPGSERVQAVCNFVHDHLRFDYQQARADRTALEAFREQVGVCREEIDLAAVSDLSMTKLSGKSQSELREREVTTTNTSYKPPELYRGLMEMILSY
jgi:hypothetical protein